MELSENWPADKVCECGHLVTHYRKPTPAEVDHNNGWEPGIRSDTDVLEIDCPHSNGTVLELCPQCRRQVGMWGMGAAGSMECTCWSGPVPWWRRLLRLT